MAGKTSSFSDHFFSSFRAFSPQQHAFHQKYAQTMQNFHRSQMELFKNLSEKNTEFLRGIVEDMMAYMQHFSATDMHKNMDPEHMKIFWEKLMQYINDVMGTMQHSAKDALKTYAQTYKPHKDEESPVHQKKKTA